MCEFENLFEANSRTNFSLSKRKRRGEGAGHLDNLYLSKIGPLFGTSISSWPVGLALGWL